jgi:hypothetical protein
MNQGRGVNALLSLGGDQIGQENFHSAQVRGEELANV